MGLPTFTSEITELEDRVTGVAVRRLTNHKGHSNHLYFTNPGWWDGDQRLVFESDRGNRTNLYSLALATGEITQITDTGDGLYYQSTFLNPVRDEAYFTRGHELRAVNLRSGDERVLFDWRDNRVFSGLSTTADGNFVCLCIRAHVQHSFETEANTGAEWFRTIYEAHPLTQIYRIPVDGGEAEVIHDEKRWITHVNFSPTQPHLLTFCHEGPWKLVSQRIWGMNVSTGNIWKLRSQAGEEAIGHEYWLADGLRIGYHGRTETATFFGFIGHDNSDHVEVNFPFDSHHFHSNAPELLVGDGRADQTPYILLWRFANGSFSEPRVLCAHNSSRYIQRTHVHPCLSPDGQQVLFTSDDTGYANLFLVDLPDVETLPTLTDVLKRRKPIDALKSVPKPKGIIA